MFGSLFIWAKISVAEFLSLSVFIDSISKSKFSFIIFIFELIVSRYESCRKAPNLSKVLMNVENSNRLSEGKSPPYMGHL